MEHADRAKALQGEGSPSPALFVVLAQPRTGSTYLCDLLNRHPAATCHGELFHPKWIGVGGAAFKGFASLEARKAAPLAFLEGLVARSLEEADVRRVGFKLFLDHEPAVLDWLARHREVAVLCLRRRSWLAQYSSFRIALADRDWIGRSVKTRARRLDFSVRDYIDFAERLDRESRRLDALVAGRRCLRLDYETLGRPAVQARIQQFLGLPVMPMTSRVTKTDPRRTLQRFNNPLAAACLGPPLRFRFLRKLARRLLRRRSR